MAKDKKDLLIPLLPTCLTDKVFNKYREDTIKKFEKKEVVELSLNEIFGISLNTTIIKTNKKLIFHQKSKNSKNDSDELDRGLFGDSTPLERLTHCMGKIKINFYVGTTEEKQVEFHLFINSSHLEKLDDVCIYTFTLTTFNPKVEDQNYVPFSNIEVINLSKQCAKTFNGICNDDKFFKIYLKELCNIDESKDNNHKNISDISVNDICNEDKFFKNHLKELCNIDESKDSDHKSIDDIFRSIQFWGNPTNYNELIDDARDIIKSDIRKKDLNNMYYFYSIVTSDYKKGLLRRHYENIVRVIGHCQSISIAYFDVFYGNVCLEVTIKPKYEIFKQIGHDSEEFRIWEILALQKHLVKRSAPLKFNNSEDAIFDFSNFTKKLEKGGSWIDYAKYLQKITGIEYCYKKRKREFELKERENERALQKLNILIIISILISLITFFLTPIYSSIKSYAGKTLFEEYIFKNSYPEISTLIFSAILTFQFWLILSPYPKKILELLQSPQNESGKNEDTNCWIIIFLELLSITLIIFFISNINLWKL